MFVPLLLNGFAPQVGIPLCFLLSSLLLCPIMDQQESKQKFSFTKNAHGGTCCISDDFITVNIG